MILAKGESESNPITAPTNHGPSNFDTQPSAGRPPSRPTTGHVYRTPPKVAEQCQLDENVKNGKIEIVYRIKENPALVHEAQRMGKDQDGQKDLNHLIE